MAITYGNTIWNYATNNADKVTFRVAAGKACDELKKRMDNSGMNYCGYNDNSGKVAVFAINKSDKDLLKLIIGDKAYNNLEFYKSEIDYIPKDNKIGNTEYKYMPNKCYFYFNKDLALFLANQLAQQNIPYSAVIRSEKSAIMTVSEENTAVLLNLAEQIKNNRLIFSDEFKKYKTASAKKETIVSQPLTKKEKSFTESNIAAFMAQAILNDKQKQAQLDNYYERIKAGDNIPELAKSMLGNAEVFTTPHGNTFTLEHSDENWVSAAFGNAHKIVTYEELNKAFISLSEENHRNFDRVDDVLAGKTTENKENSEKIKPELTEPTPLVKDDLNTEKTSVEEIKITQNDFDILKQIEPRKSILNFSKDEIKLTEKWTKKFESEIQKKSPFYRAQFGEWRDKEETIMSIITIIDKKADYKSIKSDVKSGIIERGSFINKDTGWEIQVSRAGLEDTIRYSFKHNDDIPYNMLYNIKEIVENGVLLDTQITERNKNNKAINSAFMHKLYELCKFNNETYIARMSIEEFSDAKDSTLKRLYSLQDIKIEPLRIIGLTENQLRPAVLNGSSVSIANLFEIVKTFDKDFYTYSPDYNLTHNNSEKLSVEELSVGDIILYDGKRREIEDISDRSIKMRDLDAPDFGGILLSTSDVLSYDGWKDDMNAKGFEILSKAEQTKPELTEKEKAFLETDIASIMAKSVLAWDEIEDIGYILYEDGYINKHSASENRSFGRELSEPELYDMAYRMQNGEDIRKELSTSLLGKPNVFTFENDNTFKVKYGEKEISAIFGNAEKTISYETMGNAFLSLIEGEYNDIIHDRTVEDLEYLIPDLTDKNAEQLITAFDNARMADWKGDTIKETKIKKVLYDILNDDDKTEKAFASIAYMKYNYSENNIIEDDVIGSMGFPIDEMYKAVEAENSRTDYGYEPTIGDLLEKDNKLFRISDISDNTVTLEETSSLFGNSKNMIKEDFLNSGFALIEKVSVSENKEKSENFTITDENLGEGGAKTKFRKNIEAIQTLKTLEEQKRQATKEEKEILSQYVGWGGIAQTFDKDNTAWQSEYAQLKELLTPQEYNQAKASVLDSFYTSSTVIERQNGYKSVFK